MAPIETEYGRRISAGDGGSIYVHDDDIEPVINARRETNNISYHYYTGKHGIRLNLRVECDSADEGGFAKHKITRSGFKDKVLSEGETVIKGNEVEVAIEVAPDVVIGYRAKHRAAEQGK